jgi:hypothetical protein
MDILYDNLKKDFKGFLTGLNAKKVVGYASSFGQLMGLDKNTVTGKIEISPQYVVLSHLMYPYFSTRVIFFASTLAICAVGPPPDDDIKSR